MPINRFLAQPSVSVAELHDKFGDGFSVEYSDFRRGWEGRAVVDGYIMYFMLADEHDTNITGVEIWSEANRR